MVAASSDGVSMRALVLASSLWVLLLALGAGNGAAAAGHFIRPPSMPYRHLVLEAKIVCGMSEGKFGCKSAPGVVEHGKNAIPGVVQDAPDTAPPPATGGQDATAPAPGAQSGLPENEAAKPGEHACPPGYRVLAMPTESGYCEPPAATPKATEAGCQHGMVGTPPNDCHCPKNSELLGGNCVHYTATCRSGLAANVNPEPCPGAEEKLACKIRSDGLKDCCCLTYDKL
jgi:hypothetical protein